MTEGPVLGLWGLPHSRETNWSLLGIRWLPSHLKPVLTEDALDVLDRLALALFDHGCREKGLDQELIDRAAAAVNACGGWWPLPQPRHYASRWVSGLDVPALWGVEAIVRELRALITLATNGQRVGVSLADLKAARDAAEDLYRIVAARIGPPYDTSGHRPTTRLHDAAWRRFERSVAAIGPVLVVATLTMPPVALAPGDYERPRLVVSRP